MSLHIFLRHRIGCSGRCWSSLVAILCVLTCVPVTAAPVYVSGADNDREATADRTSIDAAARGAKPGFEASSRTRPAGENEPSSEWAQFRRSLRGFFDKSDDVTVARQTSQPQRANPAFSPNLAPGAYQVPSSGGRALGIPSDGGEVAQASALELSRQAGTLNGGLIPGMPGESPVGATKVQGKSDGVPGMVSATSDVKFENRSASTGADQAAESETDGFRAPRTRQGKYLEGLLLSELIDQILPWAIGLVAVFITWQAIRLLIQALRQLQARALRSATKGTGRAMHRRR